MKTKLIALTWRGSASVDPRFSAAMLPWTVVDICTRDSYEKLSVGIENGILETYNCDFELQFTHKLKYIVGMCKVTARRSHNGFRNKLSLDSGNNASNNYIICNAAAQQQSNAESGTFMNIIGPQHGIVYLLKDPKDPLLHIHLYESECMEELSELMNQMRDPSHTHGGSVGSIPSDLKLQKSSLPGGGVVGNGTIHTTPASNLKFSEATRNASHDGSPSVVSNRKMTASKSYTSGISDHSSAVQSSSSNTSGSTTSSKNYLELVDISPMNSQFFEVLYVGKIKVSHKRVPYTFIDDAIPKFKAYDAQKIKSQADAAAKNTSNSDLSQKSSCNDLSANSDEDRCNPLRIVEEEEATQKGPSSQPVDEFKEKVLNTKLSEENKENNLPVQRKILLRGQSQVVLPVKIDSKSMSLPLPALQVPIMKKESDNAENVPKQRDRSASIGSIPLPEQNRTMVFLIGKTELRLISPDRKQVLLYKDFKDVASCAQGHKNADHFGIICREQNNEGYIGYVFKCQSDSVADDIVGTISQAFQTSSEQKFKEKLKIFSCEHCPMLWYHKLCTDIEGLSDKKTQSTIFRRIEMLSVEEQNIVFAKYYGAEELIDHSVGEQNQFLMVLLRAHCESRQQRHVHDTAENRSEFLNQYLGGSTIFMKAKRSLTSSFDHLLKRKGSKDDFGKEYAENIENNNNNNTNNNKKKSLPTSDLVVAERMDYGIDRPRAQSMQCNSPSSLRLDSLALQQQQQQNKAELKSPMMDIFIKVGNSPKESNSYAGSWRQEILNRVVTPSKNLDNQNEAAFMSPHHSVKKRHAGKAPAAQEKRTAAELRQLWRTTIRQIILLNRMEKENARLQAKHNEHELKKMKLNYDEIIQCDKQAMERWETFIDKQLRISNKLDSKVLLQAIKTGVPRSKRGEIWIYLAEQFSMDHAPVDIKKFPNFNTPYPVLLKSLTEHQHAIFIDLGRTFPNHSYYKAALGIGQLSLFNILKAYSILDPELGYCQGLGFICGILLLHCDEENAFYLLKHLMFGRKMRAKYLPDMKQFQLQLYQLSRLVRDEIPDLYEWLDQNDCSPTLYAAPWILTVFSSQFPLGFVTRVFDLLFLESSEVIFKVAIALLKIHKDELLQRDNFEEIMDYLKTVVPKIDATVLDKVMKDIFVMDIRKQLSEYNVEYNVLQEEISTTNHHLDALNSEREANRLLEHQMQFAQSSIAQLEKTRSHQQLQMQALQSQIQSLEMTVHSLGNFVQSLVDKNHSIELPGDIRRMVQQIQAMELHKKPIFVERKLGKSMSVNAQLGFPLNVLEELNENAESPTKTVSATKTPFFENTYHQIRQQNRMRSIKPDAIQPTNEIVPARQDIVKLPEHIEKAIENMTTAAASVDNDTRSLNNNLKNTTESQPPQSALESNKPAFIDEMHHPFSSCEDVNFKFNGTKQLRSHKSNHHLNLNQSAAAINSKSIIGDNNNKDIHEISNSLDMVQKNRRS